jgi:hypothetical protein
MVLIVIAAIALHRRLRTLTQQRAASRHQQGLAEHPRIPRPIEPTPPTSPDTMPERLVLQEVHAVPGQTDERTDRHAGLVSTSDLVPAVLRAGTIVEPRPGYR